MTALLAMMAVLFGITACQGGSFGQNKAIQGSGKMVTDTIKIENFHEIHASSGVKVIITDQPGDVVVQADENLIEYVTVKVREGELKIGIKPGVLTRVTEDIIVYVPDNGNIRKLDASSAAKILTDKQLTVKSLEIDASSAAKIRVDVKTSECSVEASSSAKVAVQIVADRLEVETSSAASVKFQGVVREASFEATSASSIDAEMLTTQLCEVEASSAADIRVWCEQEIHGRASSAGTIFYKGKGISGKAGLSSSSAGSFHKID